MSDQLISVEELATAAESGRAPRVLDVRWQLGRTDGRDQYREGHIPGAVFVDLDEELADHGEATDGRHPLPERAELEAAARRWGLNDGDQVVLYDDAGSAAAARGWWLLRHAGLTDVRVLDGGLSAWLAAGRPTEAGDTRPEPGDIRLGWGHLPVLSMDAAADLPAHGVLLDARAGERFRGEVEPIDPRPGHIPGARNLPSGANLTADGRFLGQLELSKRFATLGIGPDTEIGVYCGSGVTAALDILALTRAGFEPALYPGSWSQWANHPERPAALGEEPGLESSPLPS